MEKKRIRIEKPAAGENALPERQAVYFQLSFFDLTLLILTYILASVSLILIHLAK